MIGRNSLGKIERGIANHPVRVVGLQHRRVPKAKVPLLVGIVWKPVIVGNNTHNKYLLMPGLPLRGIQIWSFNSEIHRLSARWNGLQSVMLPMSFDRRSGRAIGGHDIKDRFVNDCLHLSRRDMSSVYDRQRDGIEGSVHRRVASDYVSAFRDVQSFICGVGSTLGGVGRPLSSFRLSIQPLDGISDATVYQSCGVGELLGGIGTSISSTRLFFAQRPRLP